MCPVSVLKVMCACLETATTRFSIYHILIHQMILLSLSISLSNHYTHNRPIFLTNDIAAWGTLRHDLLSCSIMKLSQIVAGLVRHPWMAHYPD